MNVDDLIPGAGDQDDDGDRLDRVTPDGETPPPGDGDQGDDDGRLDGVTPDGETPPPADGDQGDQGDDDDDDGGDTFPRAYVEKLRKENKRYREAATEADAMAERLHTALVRLDGRLADPGALKFDPAHLTDETALSDAVAAAIARNPRLSARAVAGDVGAGNRGGSQPVDLISALRAL